MTFPEKDLLKGADPTRVVLVTELALEGGARPIDIAQPAVLQEDEGPAAPEAWR